MTSRRRLISPDVWMLSAGVNTAVIVENKSAVIINPGVRGLAAELTRLGVRSVAMVLFTHHRRELADGLPQLLSYRPRILVPAAEESLFRDPSFYWGKDAARWKLLCSHVPYHVTHVSAVPVSGTLNPGGAFDWGSWRFRILATPGYTDGSVSILASREAAVIAFTGDIIHSPGKLYDLYSLQHGAEEGGHRVGDYHGYLGSRSILIDSLQRVIAEKPSMLVPAHGALMRTPAAAVRKLITNLQKLYTNYVKVSALRWYFPKYFSPYRDYPNALPRQETMKFPSCVVKLHGTCSALISDTKRAILIDPYCDEALAAAQAAIADGRITGYDGIWISHYHYDHMEAAEKARITFNCPVMTDPVTADVIASPRSYLLTCLSPVAVTVTVRAHAETWRWENFMLSVYHFPGQSYYHSGLFAVSDDMRLFFSGDSFTPDGIDDYCMWNRNFLGASPGYGRCLDIISGLAPTHIFNQHVDMAFRFDARAVAHMRSALLARTALIRALSPFDDANFAVDEYWAHTYPYEQSAVPGDDVRVAVRIWNHSARMKRAEAVFDTPSGWRAGAVHADIPPHTEGVLSVTLPVPKTARGRFIIPVRILFGGTDLGSFRECIVAVGD